MHVALIALLGVHGLAHWLGVAAQWKLLAAPAMTGATLVQLPPVLARAIPWLWLLVGMGFVASAVSCAWRQPEWWWLAAVSLGLSQLLVIHAWPDAKAGTLVNLALALLVLCTWSTQRFVRDDEAAVRALFVEQ